MDAPALRRREELATVRLGTEKSSKLIKQATDTRVSGKGFQPAGGLVPLLNSPLVLFYTVVHAAVGPVRYLVALMKWTRLFPVRLR